jgi:hypothetical protein
MNQQIHSIFDASPGSQFSANRGEALMAPSGDCYHEASGSLRSAAPANIRCLCSTKAFPVALRLVVLEMLQFTIPDLSCRPLLARSHANPPFVPLPPNRLWLTGELVGHIIMRLLKFLARQSALEVTFMTDPGPSTRFYKSS